MSDRIDRRSFLARGAATGAGLAAVGASGGLLAAVQLGVELEHRASTGSHPDGVSTATPKPGGQLIFGTEAEEKGFSPTQGTFDKTGILYARTVFDPLAIIGADGTAQPYLAQSVTPNADYTVWTITMRPNLVFHNGTPCDAAAVAANFEAQQGVRPHRPGPHHHRQRLRHQPAGGHRHHEVALGPVRLLPGRRHRRPVRLHRRAHLAATRAARPTRSAPGRSSSRNGSRTTTSPPPRTPTTGGRGSPTWTASPTSPSPTADQLLTSLELGRRRHHPHLDTAKVISAAAGQLVARLHRRLEARGRRAGHGLPAAQPVQAAVRQPQGAPGRGHASARPSTSQVIDQGVNPTSNGPFVTGSPYYAPDNGYPASNVSKAKQLVQQVQQETGQPVTVDHQPHPRLQHHQDRRVPPAAAPDGGHDSHPQPGPAGRHHQHRPARHLRGPGVAPVRGGRPRPQLHLLEPDQRINSVFSINMARNTDPAMQTALHQGPPVAGPVRPDRRLPAGRPAHGLGHPLRLGRPDRLGRSAPSPRCRTSTTRPPRPAARRSA